MKKRKWNRVFFCTFGNGDSHITYVRMWQEECEKRRERYDHSIFMEYKFI